MLCYYVTGHGFGHAIRTTQVLKALPPTVPFIVKTSAPERLFREELPGRAFEYVAAEYDCGCLQTDSVSVLKRETLTRYTEIARRNRAHLPDEIAWLKRRGVRCVVSDIPSFPLLAARAASIPSVVVGNFTWHDIYAEYAETAADNAMLAQMAEEYASAAVALITPLHLDSTPALFPNTQAVPLVTRRGVPIRGALIREGGIPAGKHLALLYLGEWGLKIDWAALEKLTEWVFLVDRPLPKLIANARIFDPSILRYADVAASVDAVISKAGYGTVTECIANSVPFIYLPRSGFAEHEALVLGMNRWGGGIEISEAAFHAGDWETALQTALTLQPDSNAFPVNGAEVVAKRLMEIYQ